MLQSWSAYCLVATGAVGILLMQSAFNSGPLHASLPTITAVSPWPGFCSASSCSGTGSRSPREPGPAGGGLFALVLGLSGRRAPRLDNLRKAVAERAICPGHTCAIPDRTAPPLGDGAPARASGLARAAGLAGTAEVNGPGPGQGPSPGQGTHPGRRPRRGVASRSGDIPARAVRGARIPDQASPTGSPGSRLPAHRPRRAARVFDHSAPPASPAHRAPTPVPPTRPA